MQQPATTEHGLFRGDGGNTVLRVLLAQLAVQPLEVLHVPREGDLQHQYERVQQEMPVQ